MPSCSYIFFLRRPNDPSVELKQADETKSPTQTGDRVGSPVTTRRRTILQTHFADRGAWPDVTIIPGYNLLTVL
jgi:hypothetical protein